MRTDSAQTDYVAGPSVSYNRSTLQSAPSSHHPSHLAVDGGENLRPRVSLTLISGREEGGHNVLYGGQGDTKEFYNTFLGGNFG